MTSKRLGILVLALAAVWSLAGLDWFAPAASFAPRPLLSVGTAQAGFEDFLTDYQTCTLEGDPDSYANGVEGDPDSYTNSPGADDSTATNPEVPEPKPQKPPKIGALVQTFDCLTSAFFDGLRGFKY